MYSSKRFHRSICGLVYKGFNMVYIFCFRPIRVPSLPTYSSKRAQKYRPFNHNKWPKKNKKDLNNNEVRKTEHEDFSYNDRPLVPSRLEGIFTMYPYCLYCLCIYNKMVDGLMIVQHNFECSFRFIRKRKQRQWKLFH